MKLDKILFLKQKIQYLEESIKKKNLTRNITTTNSGKTPTAEGYLNGSRAKISSFFNKQTLTLHFSFNSRDSYIQIQPPPTVDLTTDSDDYNEQQQQPISKLKHSQTLRHYGQKTPQYKEFPKEKGINNRNLYDNNGGNTKVRANTFGLGSYTHQNINNEKNTSNNNSENSFKSYDDLAVAEST